MRPRYLIAAVQDPASKDRIKAKVAAAAGKARLKTALELDQVLVLASVPAMPVLSHGLLLGSIFMRGSAARLSGLAPGDQRAVADSRGEWLINACWGGYLAILAEPGRGRVDILRAPLGDLPCYITRTNGGVLCASDLQLLLAASGMKAALDPAALARHLAAGDIRRRETCLVGIEELAGGERIALMEGVRQPLWSPWVFAAPERQISDPAEAAARIRDAARHCVEARSHGVPHLLLKLSGGLDSSIVAACLAQAGRPFTALTLVTNDPSGDERHHARQVAQALDAPLLEVSRDPARVDLRRSSAGHLPRPTARSFTQESNRIAAAAAAKVGAEAILDGGGGDNVFCSLQSVRPAVDALLVEAGSATFLSTANSIARLAQVSVSTVAWRTLLARWRGLSAYPWPLDVRFLSNDAISMADSFAHPWLAAPPGALPGKAAHVALVTAAQSLAEGADPQEDIPAFSPLISQPLVEACLQVPSWFWFHDGMNRSIARKGFAESLPAAIAFRRSKGSPDSFVADIYEANRHLLRDMLHEGVLARLGLLDLPPLLRVLDERGPLRNHDYLRVMQLADAEAWARCWVAA